MSGSLTCRNIVYNIDNTINKNRNVTFKGFINVSMVEGPQKSRPIQWLFQGYLKVGKIHSHVR